MKLCTICEWRHVYAKGVCRSCYVFRRKHQRDKSEGEIVAEAQRHFERRMLANHTRGIYARS